LRDITLEDTIFLAFTTRAFATGIPTVLAGTPIVSAYEDAGLTQITAGITLGINHDGVVGLNMLTIVATAANGYEAGKDYNMVITTGTVGGVSVVGEVVAQFTAGRSAAAVDLANATDGLSALRTLLLDVPTVSEFNARTILSASYFDPATDAVANVTLVATTTTNTDMRGTDSAALAAVVGALADAAAAGDPTSADTLMQYIKQLVNTLEGTVGIPVYPASADPANNVSLAEAIRAIRDDVTGLAGSAMRGTNSAALASVATEARLAELDGANLPADIDSLITAIVTASGEPAQGAPPVSAAMQEKINWIYKNFRNKKEQDATEWRLYNDDTTTVDHKAVVSDVAGTATKEEIVTGP